MVEGISFPLKCWLHRHGAITNLAKFSMLDVAHSFIPPSLLPLEPQRQVKFYLGPEPWRKYASFVTGGDGGDGDIIHGSQRQNQEQREQVTAF